jgi:hypothetical protein
MAQTIIGFENRNHFHMALLRVSFEKAKPRLDRFAIGVLNRRKIALRPARLLHHREIGTR